MANEFPVVNFRDPVTGEFVGFPALKGDKGDTGDTGTTGGQGIQGVPGPNSVSTATDSSIVGLLKGTAGKVAQAIAGTDYVAPSALEVVTSQLDAKANKAATPTAGHIATLDAGGNPIDSGHPLTDYAAAEALLADEAYFKTPITTYTHVGNTSIAVSAVDTTGDTLTSAGHGLANGDSLYAIINSNAGLEFLPNVIAGGLAHNTKYYVINKTDNTFQLSLTSGGAAIDLTVNANLGLSKWHFEKISASALTISGLPGLKAYKVVVKGQLVYINNLYMFPNGAGSFYDGKWDGNAYPSLAELGNVGNRIDILIDCNGILYERSFGITVKCNNTTGDTSTLNTRYYSYKGYANTAISSLYFMNYVPANGATVEVYKA